MKNIVIILMLASALWAQETRSPITVADSLFDGGQYFDSVTEYKRALFFNNSPRNKYDIYLRIGLCYKIGDKYENSLKYFAHALMEAENADERFHVKEQMIRVNILRRSTDQAHFLLGQLEKENPEKKSIVSYWRGWTFMFEDDWENAALEFEKTGNNDPLKKLCESVNSEKYSVNLAKIFSYIVPGLGQVYTGDYLSGLMSLGWNILCGYWTINSFVEDRIFDGLVTGNLLWLRFYRGNYQNAEKFAARNNIEIINTAYRYLKNSYKGIKP